MLMVSKASYEFVAQTDYANVKVGESARYNIDLNTFSGWADPVTISVDESTVPQNVVVSLLPGPVMAASADAVLATTLTVDALPAQVTVLVESNSNTAEDVYYINLIAEGTNVRKTLTLIADMFVPEEDRPENNEQNPTTLALTEFSVGQSDVGEYVIKWATSAESNTLGYQLVQSRDGTLASALPITANLIGSKGENGGEYEFTFGYEAAERNADEVLTFWLEETTLDGTKQYYGPISISIAPAETENSIFMPFLSQ